VSHHSCIIELLDISGIVGSGFAQGAALHSEALEFDKIGDGAQELGDDARFLGCVDFFAFAVEVFDAEATGIDYVVSVRCSEWRMIIKLTVTAVGVAVACVAVERVCAAACIVS
jgi:hypothetical protein